MISRHKYLAFFIFGVLTFLILQIISWIILRTNIFVYKNDKIVFFFTPSFLLVVMFLAIIAFIIFSVFEIKNEGKNPYIVIALSLILGGGLSNIYERILHGGVADYLNLYFWKMNIADIFIFIGIFIFFYIIIRKTKKASF